MMVDYHTGYLLGMSNSSDQYSNQDHSLSLIAVCQALAGKNCVCCLECILKENKNMVLLNILLRRSVLTFHNLLDVSSIVLIKQNITFQTNISCCKLVYKQFETDLKRP